MTPITVTTWPEEATRTPNSACAWVAEATVEGRVYVARSRHGAAYELARQLVAAGLADRPMVIHYRGRAGTMTYRSFHAAARWTFTEGMKTPLHRVRYQEQPEGVFSVEASGQKCVSSPVDNPLEPPDPCPLKTGGRRCVSCGADFFPARPWSRFCSAACRLRAHRRFGGKCATVGSVAAD